jgi:hypothetical protein
MPAPAGTGYRRTHEEVPRHAHPDEADLTSSHLDHQEASVIGMPRRVEYVVEVRVRGVVVVDGVAGEPPGPKSASATSDRCPVRAVRARVER